MNATHDLPTTIPAYLERLRRALDDADRLVDGARKPRRRTRSRRTLV